MKKTLAVVVLLVAAQAAFGAYESIQHNLLDATPDTGFDVSTGVLTIDQGPGANNLTLNDPTALPGTVTLGDFYLQTTLSGYNPLNGAAVFTGGSLMLTFNYDGLPYHIGGPIAGMELLVTGTGPDSSIIQGEGLWDAQDLEVLPGSNNWPDAGDFSSIKHITLAFGSNLGTWNWDSSISGANTSYQLYPTPDAVPEPSALALLAVGGLALIRRRR
jgi:hypothetical protein